MTRLKTGHLGLVGTVIIFLFALFFIYRPLNQKRIFLPTLLPRFEENFVVDCITKQILGTFPSDPVTVPFDGPVTAPNSAETSDQRQKSFQNVFKSKLWGTNFDKDFKGIAASGYGSTLRYAQEAILILHAVISDVKHRTGKSRVRLLDIPCGDFAWMRRFLNTRDDIDYTGMDIVPELIAGHQKTFSSKPWIFKLQDIADKPLNQSFDIIFCRMMLQHLQNYDVLRILKRFSDSGSSLLITTTFYVARNGELPKTTAGRFHSINMELPPFSFVPPLCVSRDGELDDIHGKVHFLGLWKMPLRKVSQCEKVNKFPLTGRTETSVFSCTNWSLASST